MQELEQELKQELRACLLIDIACENLMSLLGSHSLGVYQQKNRFAASKRKNSV